MAQKAIWIKEEKDGGHRCGCYDCAKRGRRGGVAKFSREQSAALINWVRRHEKHRR